MSRSTQLHQAILEAIDEALLLFGLSVRDVTYYYCESRYGAKREEIPLKLSCFIDCLHEIYGLAAKMIEAQIVKQLEAKLGIKMNEEGLMECVDKLRSHVELGGEGVLGLGLRI